MDITKINWKVILSSILFIGILSTLFFLGQHPSWKWHLAYDCRFGYYPNAKYFFEHGSFAGIANNERQPGELVFQSILAFGLIWDYSREGFLDLLVYTNILLCTVIAMMIYKVRGILGLNLFSIILISFGPICLYRMEFLTCLMMILCFLAWERQSLYLSIFYLSLATVTKIFPIFIFPYFLITSLRTAGLKTTAKLFSTYLVFILIFIFLFMIIYSVEFLFLQKSWQLQLSKPVHVESLIGSLTTAWNYFVNDQVTQGFSYGIFGLRKSSLIFPQYFYDIFWLAPLSCSYLIVFMTSCRKCSLNYIAVFFLLLTFILFNKLMTPQYLLWFVLLIPLLNNSCLLQKRFIGFLAITLIITIGATTQYLYPVHYSLLLEFYKTGEGIKLFYVLLIRNFAILIVWVLLMICLVNSKCRMS